MKDPGNATEMKVNAPQLVSLLNGTAPPSLLADALQEKFDPVLRNQLFEQKKRTRRSYRTCLIVVPILNLTERLWRQQRDQHVYDEVMRQVCNGHEHQCESLEKRRILELKQQQEQAEAMAA